MVRLDQLRFSTRSHLSIRLKYRISPLRRSQIQRSQSWIIHQIESLKRLLSPPHFLSRRIIICCWFSHGFLDCPLILDRIRWRIQKRTLLLSKMVQTHFILRSRKKIHESPLHVQICLDQRKSRQSCPRQKRKITTQKSRKKSWKKRRKKSWSCPRQTRQKPLRSITRISLQIIRFQNLHCKRKRQKERSWRILQIIRCWRLLHLARKIRQIRRRRS